ncbi:GNAT family N-acetyltransferase [Sabulicella rubraurantiaca]|uniref:GNAT family N-acetyltransferase n=1 Tax=Sabulicella rubraurantiaca TaxID=2811429 RepID=UPI001A96247E|nr:GNAT family N-acetyltransferase [Sabulicella rubraurantiaca]
MIQLSDSPTPEERQAVLDGIVAFNDAATGVKAETMPFAALVKDEAGRTLGGAIGYSRHGWLYIELLHIPEAMRRQGIGTRIIEAAEAEARRRGLLGIHLDTFSFQAPGFYERLGFARMGSLRDHPPGHAIHWYAKRFAADARSSEAKQHSGDA